MKEQRQNLWLGGAHALHAIHPEWVGYVQQLAHLDKELQDKEDLYLQTAHIYPGITYSNLADKEYVGRFADRVQSRSRDTTMAQLWVLGCYEIVRTIKEYIDKNPGFVEDGIKDEILETKRQFERIRMPLAKLQPFRKTRDTDYPFAFPGYTDTAGMAWRVSPDCIIKRAALAERFAIMLDKLAKGSCRTNQ